MAAMLSGPVAIAPGPTGIAPKASRPWGAPTDERVTDDTVQPGRKVAPTGTGLRSPHKGTAGGASPGLWAAPS